MIDNGVYARLKQYFDSDGIDRFTKGSFQGVISLVIVVRIAWGPVVIFRIGFLFIFVISVQTGPLMYSCTVYDRFKDRSYLARGFNLVVLEIFIVQITDPGFYFPGLWFHSNHRRMQNLQIMLDRIDRRIIYPHFSLFRAVYQHRFFFIQNFQYVFFSQSLMFQSLIDRTVLNSIFQYRGIFVPGFLFTQVGVIGLL